MQVKANRKVGIDTHIDRLQSTTSLAGSRVLEIGGDKWGYVSNRLIELGSDHVETINIAPAWPDKVFTAPKIFSRNLDCRKLEDAYEESSFDLIFGVAVAEHIIGIDAFLAQARRALRPGGHLYLNGGPLWTSGRGHHLFYSVDGKDYKFTDKECPIFRWEHLMNDAASLCDLLKTRGLPHAHAEGIAKRVYTGPQLNRYCHSQICSDFDESGLELVLRYNNAFAHPSPEQHSAIVARGYAADERFDVSGVTHIMRKA